MCVVYLFCKYDASDEICCAEILTDKNFPDLWHINTKLWKSMRPGWKRCQIQGGSQEMAVMVQNCNKNNIGEFGAES